LLTVLDDRRGILAPIMTFSLIAVFVAFGLRTLQEEAWGLVFFVLPGIATQQPASFVLAHEAAHYRMLKSRMLNDFVGRAGTLGGV
jgi:fatty acid desaturase